MSVLWGNDGPATSWCRLHNVSQKEVVNLVCEVACNQHDSGAILVLVLPSNFFARIEGMAALEDGVQTITITDLRYVGTKRLHTFVTTESTVVKRHSRVEHRDFLNLTELCCGMGVATQGFQHLGFNTVLACDSNEKFVAAYQHFHPGVNVIKGDVTQQDTIRQLVASSGRPSIAFVGFSCQPFSKGGAQLGVDDSRSSSLVGSLEVCFLLRCPAIILECVPDAASNKHVRATLSTYCTQCLYHLSEIQLQQEHIWPCRRDRWWVLLTASSLGACSLRPFPRSSYPSCVKQILPHCWNMEPSEMEELKLSPTEHERFLQFRPDLSSMLLNAKGVCPTILHSCGSQVLPCPCQCRKGPFSDQTLAKRGIYGILMPAPGVTVIQNEVVVALRHPHPNEIAILSGTLLPSSWPPQLRFVLSGLGQQANPCQALWVGCQLLAHVDLLIGGVTRISACSELDRFLTLLIDQSKKCFADMLPPVPAAFDVLPSVDQAYIQTSADEPPLDLEVLPAATPENLPLVEFARSEWMHHGEVDSFTVLSPPDFHPHVVKLSSLEATVGNLVAAEIGMSPTLSFVEVVDPSTGSLLDHATRLSNMCVLVCTPSVDDLPEMGDESKNDDGYASPSPTPEEVSPTIPFVVDALVEVDQDLPLLDEPAMKRCRIEGPQALDDGGVDVVKEAVVANASPCREPDPLVKLSPAQLLALVPPVVSTLQVFKSMTKPTMTVEDRLAVLDSQGTAWSDDEIRWHLEQVVVKAERPGTVILDPLIASECIQGRGDKLLHEWLSTFPDKPKVILSALCVNEHWTPFAWTYASDCLQANSWDLPTTHFKAFNLLHDKLSKALLCRTFLTRVLHRSIAVTEGCGVCAIRFLDYFMRAKMLPTSDSEVQTLRNDGKQLFRKSLFNQTVVARPWTWGFGLDPQVADRLTQLLHQHGVPKEACEQRAFVIQQALGVQALQQALVGTSPWRTLKALSNQSRPPLQLVLPDELQASLQTKSASKLPNKKKKKQEASAPSAPQKPQPLDPAKVKFDEGAFVTDCGSPLQQITVGQLGPLVEGVALTTLSSVEQFLRNGTPVSKGHLAVFILNADEASMTTRLPWTLCRVALRCVANNEPMLLQGFLVQLGSTFVQQGKARHEIDVADVSAACVKLALYRDGVSCPWDDIVAGPVKYLFKVLELLVPCAGHDSAESCRRWHPPNEGSVRDPVFDVWRRQWLSLSMQPCGPAQASIFMVNVRYAKELETRLLAQSGDFGIFMEPRSLDSKSSILDYQVIWLPRKTLPEALHIRQTNPCVVGLARMGSRLGVRARIADIQALGQLLRPDSIVLASGPRMDFELGPLPYGLDRSGVAALCKKWGWVAKPVNPSRSVVGDLGTVWLVQACSDPPSSVFSLRGSDVAVTKLPSKHAPTSVSSSSAVATPATLSLCAMDSSAAPSKVDPWLLVDPWGFEASKAPLAKAPQPDLTLNLQQIEDRIEQSVLAKIPKPAAAMDIDESSHSPVSTSAVAHHDARLHALETQVNRLLSGHQVLEQRVDEGAKKTEAQISQVQHQVAAHIEAQSSRMEDLFQAQMNRLESLLNKKARTE